MCVCLCLCVCVCLCVFVCVCVCVCVCACFDIIDKSSGEFPLAWCEVVCSVGSGEQGRKLISTLAPLPLPLLLLLPGS